MRSVLLLLSLASACGSRTGTLEVFDAGSDAGSDAGRDGGPDGGADGGPDAGPDARIDAGCQPIGDGCRAIETCNNGSDDDCNGLVDDGCFCDPGSVQGCFAGPPARRDVGACQDGSQVCESTGRWGPCTGGILPNADVCTGRDDLCDGCSDQRRCPIDCPSPGDPRVPDGTPFTDYVLDGALFYAGEVRSWRWRVEGGPCDALAPRLSSFELEGATSQVATFTPRLSGDYRVTLALTTARGDELRCSWLVHVEGPGLRVEMCYPESETQDLDLFLHQPDDATAWYPPRGTAFQPNPTSCGWHNCEATIRGTLPSGMPYPRANWGYEDTALAGCEGGPLGDQWRARGSCANPRLDIDNNLSEGTGVPENINVDNPRDGQSFRIMVQNFSGPVARPVVNIYCGGRRVSTFGQAPDVVPGFRGRRGDVGIGAMWRVADVRVRVDAAGQTDCEVTPLHAPGATSGYYVTFEDPSF